MNLQQIFDKAASHLLQQGERSWMVNRFSCAYRSEGGLKCAVGCLIDDSAYSPELEGTSVECSTNVQMALGQSGIEFDIGGQVMRLVTRLQWIHDIKDAHDWPYHLDKVADAFKLNKNYTGVSKDAI